MYRVLVTTTFPDWPLLRQTPGSSGRWHEFEFVVNQEVDSCDAWVVLADLPQPMHVMCPTANTLFVSVEPPAVRNYSKKFLGQFHSVVVCGDRVEHPRSLSSPQGLPWHVGVDRDQGDRAKFGYDEFAAMHEISKSHLISTVISTKKRTAAHRQRQRFVTALQDVLGDQLHLFGRGYRSIPDKWDAIAPYRFHLVLENDASTHYFSEKLTDAYLGAAYPLYFGCPNIKDYFPADALRAIDIFDVPAGICAVQEAIECNLDQTHRSAVEAARRQVLDEYNLFPLLARILREQMQDQPPQRVEIVSFRNRFQLAIRSITRRAA